MAVTASRSRSTDELALAARLLDSVMPPDALSFGVSRAHGDADVVAASRMFAAALESALGRAVRVRMARDYLGALEDVIAGAADFAWLPPLVHARAVTRGAELCAVPDRGGALTYRSAIVVQRDSPYRTLHDLSGARAAWGDARSAASHVFPMLELQQAGVFEDALAEQTFLGGGRAACAAVADGRADFGATHVSEEAATDPQRALEDLEKQFAAARWRLRVLAVSRAIPPDGIVLAPSAVRVALARSLCGPLLEVHRAPAGREAIRRLFGATRLVPPSDAVRAAVRRLPPGLAA